MEEQNAQAPRPVGDDTQPIQQTQQTNQQPPAPQPAPANNQLINNQDPGSTLAIVSLVMILLFPLVGLILAIIARNKSRDAGYNNELAKISLIINAILVGIGALFIVPWIIFVVMIALAGA